jgi:polyketide cyclase/dehydrase/lipid transport protein
MMAMDKWVVCLGALTAAVSIGRPAAAEVISAGQNGFEIRETVHVAATPDKAYAALLQPARWWSSEHTFSGSAANLALDARAGGCWCETLTDGGSVEHMRVVYAAPGKVLRLRGALGPLQGLGVEGAMTLSVKAGTSGADISINYAAGGYVKDGFDALSKGVDHVLGEQLERLRKLIDG